MVLVGVNRESDFNGDRYSIREWVGIPSPLVTLRYRP